ncbi:Anthocyanin 3'-O-beta-glucosyltransferase [Hordeum vulgare]|nr:Anthocyanin 3'-O-beta-glucosyltransferase [Hordeum vulgare]
MAEAEAANAAAWASAEEEAIRACILQKRQRRNTRALARGQNRVVREMDGLPLKEEKEEDRVVDFSYVYANLTYQQQCRKELLTDMKAEMAAKIAKKDADMQKLNQKYELLCNLTSAQATIIQNLKLKNTKDKELLSEPRMNLDLKNAEFTKFEEKLSQEKLELKF